MKCRYILLFVASCCALTSCFKDEPLNAECDIEEAYIHSDAPQEMFFNLTDTLVRVPSDKDEIIFTVKKKADLTALAPRFRITEGATMEPENGSTHDFSNGPVTYKVTSQDGEWSRTYRVSFEQATRTVTDIMNFDFERYYLETSEGKYYVWNDIKEDGTDANNWATGNPGFRLSLGSAKPEEYPTVPVAEGYDGACVKLETKSTGPLGAMVGKRLAAGNLFIGRFESRIALTDAMNATQFGLPFDRKPLRFTGYYKYKAGETFQDKDGKTIDGKTDEGRVYSVLYRNHDDDGKAIVLHGDDVLTNPLIVAIADAGHVTDKTDWTYFDVEYEYKEDIDETLLNEQGYSLTIVFSSSDRGASFEGAIGSTLYVDKVSVECDKIVE